MLQQPRPCQSRPDPLLTNNTCSHSLMMKKKAGLFLYDGSTFTNLTGPINAFDISVIYSIATNGNIWMIGGRSDGGQARLISYDGVSFTDLSANVSTMVQVRTMATNGLT